MSVLPSCLRKFSQSDPCSSHRELNSQNANNVKRSEHLKLGFNLFQDGHLCDPDVGQLREIMSLFPTCFAIILRSPFVVVACRALPAEPWPVTVAGMPLYLTTNAKDVPIVHSKSFSGPETSVESRLEETRTPGLDTFKELFRQFDGLDARIYRIQWINGSFVAFGIKGPHINLETHQLPIRVSKISITYVFSDHEVREEGYWKKYPAGRVAHDEVDTEPLRPCIMVSLQSCGDYDTITTSGICLRDLTGVRYTSGARHGMMAKRGRPGGIDEEAIQLSLYNQVVSDELQQYSRSHHAVWALGKNIRLLRKAPPLSGDAIHQFRDILNIQRMKMVAPVYTQSPSHGRYEDILLILDVRRAWNEAMDKREYAIGFYVYFGNGTSIPDDCAGAVIFDSKNNVLGQFQYQQDDGAGLCYCSTFGALHNLGESVEDLMKPFSKL